MGGNRSRGPRFPGHDRPDAEPSCGNRPCRRGRTAGSPVARLARRRRPGRRHRRRLHPAGQQRAPAVARDRRLRRGIRGRRRLRRLPPARVRRLGRLAPRPRHAGRDARDGPRRLRRRRLHPPRRHLPVLPAGRPVLREHRGPGRNSGRLRADPHSGGRAAAAVPRAVSRRTPAEPAHRLGHRAEPVVPPLSRRAHRARRPPALDGPLPDLEPAVRGMPLDGPAKGL